MSILIKGMEMYEELVKRLRNISNSDSNIKSNYIGLTMIQPADAIEELSREIDIDNDAMTAMDAALPRWIPVTEAMPSDFVSVQAHMTDAGDFPSVREAYVVDEGWFFPSLKEFHPVDMWKQFDEPPREET